MKRINPLYLLGASLFLMLLFLGSTFFTKSELAATYRDNMALKKEIDAILELKKEYGDPKKKKRDLQRIADNSLIKPFVKTNTMTAAKGTLHLEAADAKAAKWFLQKLLNENFRIQELDIKKNGDAGLDIKTEILF